MDGDHTYEGARADYERWRELLAPGADLLFHDAVDVGGYGNHYPGIARLVGEIERTDATLERQRGHRLDRPLHAQALMRLVAVVLSWNGREDTLACARVAARDRDGRASTTARPTARRTRSRSASRASS